MGEGVIQVTQDEKERVEVRAASAAESLPREGDVIDPACDQMSFHALVQG